MDTYDWVSRILTFVTEITSALAWPGAIVLVAFILRKQLSSVLQAIVELFRTREVSVGSEGLKFGPMVQRTTPAPDTPLREHPDPNVAPLISKLETAIRSELAKWQSTVGGSRDDALVRITAAAVAYQRLDTAYHMSFGSQLAAIKWLSEHNDRGTVTDLRRFYDVVAAKFPTDYATFPFDTWCAFLINYHLIEIKGEDVTLTEEGKALPFHINDRKYSWDRRF